MALLKEAVCSIVGCGELFCTTPSAPLPHICPKCREQAWRDEKGNWLDNRHSSKTTEMRLRELEEFMWEIRNPQPDTSFPTTVFPPRY